MAVNAIASPHNHCHNGEAMVQYTPSLEDGVITLTLPETCSAIALCGGPYSNFAAVEAFLAATRDGQRPVGDHRNYRFCLGDLGGFGPEPNRTIALLREHQVICIQGNYDHAVGHGERDCGCGYSDPRDQQFAQISYDYTYAHTGEAERQWLQQLPHQIRLQWGNLSLLLCHGSPDTINEFVWDSTTSDDWLEAQLAKHRVQAICATHSGIPWIREVSNGFWFNVGVLGRPAHDGEQHVYYGNLYQREGRLYPELVPLTYDVERVVAAMAAAGLPSEFQASLQQGIWTTCAAILPEAEQQIGSRMPQSPSSAVLS